MTKSQVDTLDHGLYRIYWKSGGYSLASVGSDGQGNRWYAPTNWVTVPGFDWSAVSSAALVESKSVTPHEPKFDPDN